MSVSFWVLIAFLSYFAFMAILDTIDKAIQRRKNRHDGS